MELDKAVNPLVELKNLDWNTAVILYIIREVIPVL